MIINESIPKDNITVIRKDGKELDVGVFGIHPQTSEEEYLREDWWFYENTQNPKLKEMLFICHWKTCLYKWHWLYFKTHTWSRTFVRFRWMKRVWYWYIRSILLRSL